MDTSKFQPKFEVPEDMRDFAEKSVEQARKAFDGFIGAASKAVESIEGSGEQVRANAKDLTRKTLSYAEQNMRAAFDHAQQLVRTKDVQEAVKLQTEFVQSQFKAMQDQAKDLGSLIHKSATEATQSLKQKG